MNSTLKPHLFVEVIGLQRDCLSPQKLCGLFLADRNFSEVFAIAFRHPCKVRHRYRESRIYRYPYLDDTYVGYDRPGEPFTVKCKNGIFFQFTKEHHIPALLRIAGRLIQEHGENCPDEKWVEPFFQGLDENKCLESVGSYCSKVFLQKYLRSHDVLPNVECVNFAMLDDLNNAKIDTLVVRAPIDRECFENDEPARITNIEVTCASVTMQSNPLNLRYQTLNFDKKLLKRLTIWGRLHVDVAVRMLKTYKMVDEIGLHRVKIPFPLRIKPMKDILDRLHIAVDKLWKATLIPSGQVTVWAYYDREMKETLTELTTVCRAHLTGYEITVNSSSVDGTIVKQHGNKTLEVFVGFYARR